MDLEPAPRLEPGDEQATGRRLVEQLGGVGASGQHAGELRVDPARHGHVGQHVDEVRRLSGEGLAEHVVVDEERVVRPRDARVGEVPPTGARRQRRQLEAGRPTVGPGDDRGGALTRQIR